MMRSGGAVLQPAPGVLQAQQLHILTTFTTAGLRHINHSNRTCQGMSNRRAGNLLRNSERSETHPLVSKVVRVDVFQGDAHQVRRDVGEDPWQLFSCLQVRTGLREFHITQVLM